MSAPSRTESNRVDRIPTRGGDLVTRHNTPEDNLRFWVEGEAFPRIVLDIQNGVVLQGGGAAPPGVLSGVGLPPGGTTGQLIAKASGASGDFTYVNAALLSNDVPLAPFGAGSAGSAITAMRSDAFPPASSTPKNPHLPLGALAATMDRMGISGNGATVAASGVLHIAQLQPIYPGQQTVSGSFVIGGTAATSPTHWWFVLLNASRQVVAVTADQLTAALPVTTVKTLPWVTPYTPTGIEELFLGVCIVASGVPTFLGGGPATPNLVYTPTIVTPSAAGTCDSGLTTPPALGFVAIAPNSYNGVAYGWIS